VATVLVLLSCLGASAGNIHKKPAWAKYEARLPSLAVRCPLVVDSVLQPDFTPAVSNERAVLCRERNGWCPYSERVWLALEVKNADYDTVLIDNMMGGARPEWYTGQTPQVRFTGDAHFSGESIELIERIDREYNNVKPPVNILYPVDRVDDVRSAIVAFKRVFPSNTRPSSRAPFLSSSSSGAVLRRSEFESTLSQTESLLKASSEKWGGGPFICGDEITAADCVWAPFLERYAAQLPLLHDGLDPTDASKYPHLAKWYNAMDTLVPCYASRVKGDAISLRKVLQQRGCAGITPQSAPSSSTAAVAGRSSRMLDNMRFVAHQYYSRVKPWVAGTPHEEAVALAIRNKDRLVLDMTRRAMNGGGGGGGAAAAAAAALADSDDAENALYQLVRQLFLSLDENQSVLANGIGHGEDRTGDGDGDGDGKEEGAPTVHDMRAALAAAHYMTERMCVPRDMGSTTARCYYDVRTKLEGLLGV
jgi:glutathione S-transferase